MSDQLDNYLALQHSVPFVWSNHSCVMFAADWFDTWRGTSVRKSIIVRFPVRSAADYARLLVKKGSLRRMVESVINEPSDEGIERGDIVLCRNEDGREILGIAVPPVVLAKASFGFEALPMSSIICHWNTNTARVS